MIEVNLLPGKKPAAGVKFKLALPDFRALFAQITDPWLIAAVAAWLLVGVGAGFLFTVDQATLGSLGGKLDSLRTEKRRYDVVIAQKRQAERARDSLLAQIQAIRGIDADRYVWPHILDQLTKALPPYTWLTDVSVAAGSAQPAQPGGGQPAAAAPEDSVGVPVVRFGIIGRTVDIQAYTTFLRQLANSPWLTEVTPGQSQTRIESDRPVTEFTVTARFRLADSIYIRTVPLVQSVR